MSVLFETRPEVVIDLGDKANGDTIALDDAQKMYKAAWTGNAGERINITGGIANVPYVVAIKSNGSEYRFAANLDIPFIYNPTRYVRRELHDPRTVSAVDKYDLYEIWCARNDTGFPKIYYITSAIYGLDGSLFP